MKPDLASMGGAVRRLNPHLFGSQPAEGRGQRGEVSREAALHDDIMDFCRQRGWIFYHGSMAERTHRTEGEPDFVILADGGRVFLIECKSAMGKLSPAQRDMAAHAAKLGHRIEVVRSMIEFADFILGVRGAGE